MDKNINKSSNVDGLIVGLCEDLSPIKKIWCPYRNLAFWSAISFSYFIIVINIIGLRPDFLDKLKNDPMFLFEVLLGVLFSVTAALCASFLTVPDMRGKTWLKAVPTTIFSIFVLLGIVKSITYGMEMPHMHWVTCIGNGFFMEAFPLAFIILLSVRGKTTQPFWLTFMNILSVAGITWVGLRMTCPMDDMGHEFFYHFLPVSLIGAFLIVFARKIFKW